ncbi:FAD-binding oxidoreductase [Xinfangfangia sp. D13-10-4-6]|nr:FAD-binding oxidoreductase [Pseudogemmobacter hezensis]
MGGTAVDVTVRGAGIFGLSTAWALVRRGAAVRVIETRSIGAGASGGIVGALAPHAPEKWNPMKAFQFQSLTMAASWWEDVQRQGGLDPLYARSGRVQAVADAPALLLAQERAEAARTLWQGQAEWQLVAASGDRNEPHAPGGCLIRDSLTARIAPRAACASLVAALQARGAEIVIGEAPDEGQVVHATGVDGLQTLSEAFGQKLGGGVKGQAVLLDYDARHAPQVYAPGLHIVFHGDGTTAIGSTSESTWDAPGPDAQCDALLAGAIRVLPALADAPLLERWAGIRPRAKSRSPLVGPWPGRPGHFLANGGFKTGFGMAPLCAELLAQLILEGAAPLPPAFLPEALI